MPASVVRNAASRLAVAWSELVAGTVAASAPKRFAS
jgi:hypothetical protein